MSGDGSANRPGCALNFFLVALAIAYLNLAAYGPNGHLGRTTGGVAAQQQPAGPLPDVGLSGGALSASATPSASSTTTTLATGTGGSPGGGTPRGGTPPPPPPPPPAECALPGSITASGGSPSSLGPSGGLTTVVSKPFVLSVGGLVSCGAHYRLSFNASGGSRTSYGADCKTNGFSYDISGSVQVGDSVDVHLELPPNACG